MQQYKVLLAAAFLLVAALHVTPARACPPVRVDPRYRTISVAGAALQRGEYEQAAQLALEVFPSLRQGGLPHLTRNRWARGDYLGMRAMKTFALAVIRGEGLVSGYDDGARAMRLERIRAAVAGLRELRNRRPTDWAAASALAEGLRKLGAEDEALRILSELQRRGRLRDAHAYAALAELYHQHDRLAERDRAVKSCQRLPGGSVCPLFRKM